MKNQQAVVQEISHREALAYIEREHSGEGLTRAQSEALRHHLRDCPECRQVYDRYVLAERMLCDAPANELSPAQLARIEDRLFGEPARPTFKWPAMFGGLAMATAMAALFVVMPDDETFQSRGNGVEADLVGTSVRLLRVEASASKEPGLSEMSDGAAIGRDTPLLVVAACPHAECKVSVEVQTADGDVHPLIDPQPVAPDDGPRRLAAPRRLPAGWPAGASELHAVFQWPPNHRATRRIAFRLEP